MALLGGVRCLQRSQISVTVTSIWQTNYTKPGSKTSMKGKVIMGDKSPKSVHKQASQKQAKANAEAQKKKQAFAAKQVVGQK